MILIVSFQQDGDLFIRTGELFRVSSLPTQTLPLGSKYTHVQFNLQNGHALRELLCIGSVLSPPCQVQGIQAQGLASAMI